MNTIDECTEVLIATHNEKRKLERMMRGLSSATPDMIWAKDIEGRYIWCNNRLVNGLLQSGTIENTLGKTDLELSREFQQKVQSMHTAGEVCYDSDKITLAEGRPMRFVEHFIVDDRPLVLSVHKNVLKNEKGDIVGTVGIGRDITYEFNKLNALSKEKSIPEHFRKCINDLIMRNYMDSRNGN